MDISSLHAALSQSAPLLVFTAGLFGLIIGSFLNVVIHRLPIMLEREWADEDTEQSQAEPFNLAKPRSSCPNCGHKITAWENIPLLSYIFLKGRCRQCATPISIRYPLVELATALLSIAVVMQLGATWAALAALLFTWFLIALTFIDADTQLLPDKLTLPLLWLGLLVNTGEHFTQLPDAVWGAALGYLSLWSIYHLFKLATGKEGMGYGDFKLLAALGAWMGWQMLPAIILISSVIGVLVGIVLIVVKRHEQGNPIPFGPFLAAAGWVCLFWGQEITQSYLQMSSL